MSLLTPFLRNSLIIPAIARFALILGDRELDNGTVAVKDLAAQTQTDMDLVAVVPYLVRELSEEG